MVRSYFDFARVNWQQLLFGALLMALSSFGQTYFVAVSGSYFREAFNLSDGGLGATYAAGTILSAMTLTWAGRLIDYTTVRRFTWGWHSFLRLPACSWPLVQNSSCSRWPFISYASADRA